MVMNDQQVFSPGESTPLFKTCIICGTTKSRKDFLRPKKNGRMRAVTYCSKCAELDDLGQQIEEARKIKDQKDAQNTYNFNIEDLDPTAPSIMLQSYKPKYQLALSYHEAAKYVNEQAARVVNQTKILKLYDKKKLRELVIERDNGICYFCGEQGEQIYRLIPKEKGGLWSPANSVCICRLCNLLPISDKLKRVDKNPHREIGVHSHLRKACSVCRKSRKKNEFIYSSICKSCWKTRLNLKEHPSLKAEIKEPLSMIDRINIQNVIRSAEFIMEKQQLVDDINLLQSNSHIIQVFKGGHNRWEWRVIHTELAVLLIDEGFCKIVPYYPNIIVNIFSQSYKTFRKQILRRDKYTCQYCGMPGRTIDHKHPASQGGFTSPRNCVTACLSCNVSKADTSLDLFLVIDQIEEAEES